MEPVTSANKADVVIKAAQPVSNQDLMESPPFCFALNVSKSLAVLFVICRNSFLPEVDRLRDLTLSQNKPFACLPPSAV